MRKVLLMFATVSMLALGCSSPRPYTGARVNERYDDHEMRESRLELRLDRYEDQLNLTRRQKRELENISEKYERRGLTQEERTYREAYRRLQQQKRRELLSVLTQSQREKLRQLEDRDRGYYRRRS